MTNLGHNKRVGGVSADQLRAYIERIERLEQEKAGYATDIREVLAEAKGQGFSVPAIRTILKMRKKDDATREEEEAVLDTYLRSLGMVQPDLFDGEEA